MASAEDREGLAAEFVLGTLTEGERRDAEAVMQSDAAFRADVEAWEQRLSPLALALEPAEVPDYMRERVLKAVPDEKPAVITNVDFPARARRWRTIAIAGWAMAAAAAGFVLIGTLPSPPPAGRFVAVLQTEGPGPAFIASVDVARGTISVRAVTAEVPEAKSYELWALGAGRDKPQSLGVIDAGFRIPATRLGKVDSAALGQTVFAVSLEPQGGSPTGQPTGPVLFTGKLVATE
jgi:anti-sigma-K factor RskA